MSSDVTIPVGLLFKAVIFLTLIKVARGYQNLLVFLDSEGPLGGFLDHLLSLSRDQVTDMWTRSGACDDVLFYVLWFSSPLW